MYKLNNLELGIYEKALPKGTSWQQKLNIAKEAGYTFVEMSIDETQERIDRLFIPKQEIVELRKVVFDSGLRVPSICLSAHRKYPFGSKNVNIRQMAHDIMDRAIELSVNLGVRTIQLAGYDVYYEASDDITKQYFLEGLIRSTEQASNANIMLAIEIMDTPFINSITKYLYYADVIKSPWLKVYPDVGNLSAWGNNLQEELSKGIDHIVAVHLKDTLAVTPTFGGQFRDVIFGEGCVDFVEVFKILKKLNYSGAFLVEMWTEKSANPMQEIKHARQWIVNKMQEGGMDVKV